VGSEQLDAGRRTGDLYLAHYLGGSGKEFGEGVIYKKRSKRSVGLSGGTIRLITIPLGLYPQGARENQRET